MAILDEETFVEALEYKIKATDHLSGKVDELVVEFSVVLFKMCSLNFEYIFFEYLELIELIPVYFFADYWAFAQLHQFKIHDEVFECVDDMLGIDIGAVDDSDIVAGQRVGLLNVLRGAWVIVRALMNSMRKVQIGTRLDRSASGGVALIEPRFTHSNYVKKSAMDFK